MVLRWLAVLTLAICLGEIYCPTARPLYYDPNVFWYPRLRLHVGKPSQKSIKKETHLSIRRYRLVTLALALSHHLRDTSDKVYYNPLHPAFYNSTYRNCLRYLNMVVSWTDIMLKDPKKEMTDQDSGLKIRKEEKAIVPHALRVFFPYITEQQWAEEDSFNKLWGKRPAM